MFYRIYSAESKLSLIDEFKSRKISMRAFCKEKDLCLSTFSDWLKKVKLYGMLDINICQKNQTIVLYHL